MYQRNRNFITNDLETQLADMYHAKKVFLTNSCMEAITALFEYLLPTSGKVLVNRDTYYETRQWLQLVKRYQVTELDFSNLDVIEKELEKEYDVICFDNPSFFFEFYDIKKICELAHKHNTKVIVDNTLLSIYYI